MTTLTISYNEKNRTAEEVLIGLIKSGAITVKGIDENFERKIKKAIREAENIAADIEQNSSKKLRTMDDVINEMQEKIKPH